MDGYLTARGGLVSFARAQKWDFVAQLVYRKASVDERLDGRTALHHAASYGHTQSVGLLLAFCADPDGRDPVQLTPHTATLLSLPCRTEPRRCTAQGGVATQNACSRCCQATWRGSAL